jgi:ABC-type bacteriocin/lantibiotic exporter with double-glycine peptidase domain
MSEGHVAAERGFRPTFLAPEVVQTSAMDCGPASLKCLLAGFGVEVSYGRLREACQTDVDGTSIDVMEEVANQLGLRAEQMLLPHDHLLLAETDIFPAMLVIRNPDGNTHFIVVWRRIGAFVQIMDPATGRRWIRGEELLTMTHQHAMPLSAEAWREWAGSGEFLAALRVRMGTIVAADQGGALLARALEDPSCRGLSALDASTRMVATLVRSGAIDRGASAASLLRAAWEEAWGDLEAGRSETSIPAHFFSAGPHPVDEDGAERVLLRGAVLVRVRRDRVVATAVNEDVKALSPELLAALHEPPAAPLRDLVRLLREDGLTNPLFVAGAALFATVGTVLEALVLRGLLGVGRHLVAWEQRVGAVVALVVFFACLLGMELPLVATTLRMGRNLETRLRVAFLEKIPRLGDRYFHSRPTSDMTQRAHAIYAVRQLPALGYRLMRSAAELGVTAVGLVWLDPPSAPIVLAAAAISVAIPWSMQSTLIERDLKVHAYQGSLTRYYLDALLGLMALRTHGAERSLRREYETVLGELRGSMRGLLGASISVETVDGLLGVVVAVWLLFRFLGGGQEPAGALLLIFWALRLPVLGQDIAVTMRQYPAVRNLTLRLLEPLGAIEDESGLADLAPRGVPDPSGAGGVTIVLDALTVRAAGNTILEDVSLRIGAGEHVAIVGPSGAGKSSLVGLLLGWHRASEGEVLVDGAPLRGERLDRLRLETAWVDPTVQLWNRSMLENLRYGAPVESPSLATVLEDAGVLGILEGLPEGLGSSLGDGGALVSGGEGQRIRLARAMLRAKSRLTILDEPFRGLDRERRAALLTRSRDLWRDATLLCVTHDVEDTLGFPRVLVVDEGRVVEDGAPNALATQEGSRYRGLLEAAHMVHGGLWQDPDWRRIYLRGGRIEEPARAISKASRDPVA